MSLEPGVLPVTREEKMWWVKWGSSTFSVSPNYLNVEAGPRCGRARQEPLSVRPEGGRTGPSTSQGLPSSPRPGSGQRAFRKPCCLYYYPNITSAICFYLPVC